MSYYVTNENSFLDIKNAHLRVTGNVHTDVLKLGAIEFQPTGSEVTGTVNFTNVTTGVTTSSNLNVGGTLQLGTVEVVATTHTLANTTALGNVTPHTIEVSNVTTGLVTTANVSVGRDLTVTGNVAVDTNTLFVDSVNNRVGVGTATPSANLHVTGNAYVSSNLEVGTANLFVDTTNNRVGIGTDSPIRKLEAVGNQDENGEYSFSAGVGQANTYETRIYIGTDVASNSSNRLAKCALITEPYTSPSNWGRQKLHFCLKDTTGVYNDNATVSDAKMTLLPTGNVGIGTTSPVTKLNIEGDSGGVPPTTGGEGTSNGIFRVRDNYNVALDIGTKGSSPWTTWLQVADTTSMGTEYPLSLQPNGGNVGIGVANPTVTLDVAGSAANGKSLQLRSGDVNNGTDAVQIIFSHSGNPYNSGGYAHSIRTRHQSGGDGENAIDFWCWNTTNTTNADTLGNKRVMTIEGTGRVGIGKTDPGTALDVNGVIKSNVPSWNMWDVGTNASGTINFTINYVPAQNCTVTLSTGRVTATVAGRYFVSFHGFTESDVAANTSGGYYIRKNGSGTIRNYHKQPITGYSVMGAITAIMDLAVNDYVDVASDFAIHSANGAGFCGFMIG